MFGFVVYVTLVMLIESGRKKDAMDYSKLTEKVFGPKTARVLDFSITLSNLGALMSYFNTIGTLGAKVVSHWQTGIWISSYAGFMLVFVTLVEVPFILIRSYGELAVISYGSLAFIVFVVLFVVCATPPSVCANS